MQYRRIARTLVVGLGAMTVPVLTIAAVAALPPSTPASARTRAWLRNATYVDTVGVLFQEGSTDCGVAALAMVARTYHVAPARFAFTRARVLRRDRGLTLAEMQLVARYVGLDLRGARTGLPGLRHLSMPVVAQFPNHYVVVDRVDANGVDLRDPEIGRIHMRPAAFAAFWTGVVAYVGRPSTADAAVPLVDRSPSFSGTRAGRSVAPAGPRPGTT